MKYFKRVVGVMAILSILLLLNAMAYYVFDQMPWLVRVGIHLVITTVIPMMAWSSSKESE